MSPADLPVLLLWLLAGFILVSGLDDLVVAGAWLAGWLRSRLRSTPLADPADSGEQRIAIFLPLWREEAVVRQMLEHNLAAIRYGNFDLFAGAYPNDDATLDAVRECESRYPNVHLALCPHDGPTSKADCLNWIWQRMLLWEDQNQARFQVIVTHDAEDLIHPEELALINRHTREQAMVQVPVLPLPTPWWEFTHGVYCDEFAEYQTKDIPARVALGGFLPSNGVGTGFQRTALEALAEEGPIFRRECLTEDYDIGYRLHRLGLGQHFIPIRHMAGCLVATREYFPRTARQALRQRTRWVTGIALQSWERHGWPRSQAFWFWRDRKGLIGNLVSVAANLALGAAVAGWYAGWRMPDLPAPLLHLLSVTLAVQLAGLGMRVGCCGRVYGWTFAAGAPLRMFWANAINACATAAALAGYLRARIARQPLRWTKTEHCYPGHESLRPHKRRLGEILVEAGRLTGEELESALQACPPRCRLGEHLVAAGSITETELFAALAAQQGLPLLESSPAASRAARALPRRLAERWQVLPWQISEGAMHLAVADLPRFEMERELSRHTRLELRFYLMPPSRLKPVLDASLGNRRRRPR